MSAWQDGGSADRLARREIAQLIRQNRRLAWTVRLALALCGAALLGVAALHSGIVQAKGRPDASDLPILRARGLVIVDADGTERLVLGAPLPDPRVLGKRINRDVSASGILLFDADGNERGGYVTTDSGVAMLSLDDSGHMVARLMAPSRGGVQLQLADEAENRASLGTTAEGPYLLLQRRGKDVLREPRESAEAK